MIIRGTTPYHTFTIPLLSEEIDTIYITYLQNGQIKLEKDKSEITLVNLLDLIDDPSELTDEEKLWCQAEIHLSQADTLNFEFHPAARKNIAVIQVRVKATDGEAYTSDPIRERIMGTLKEGEI